MIIACGPQIQMSHSDTCDCSLCCKCCVPFSEAAQEVYESGLQLLIILRWDVKNMKVRWSIVFILLLSNQATCLSDILSASVKYSQVLSSYRERH